MFDPTQPATAPPTARVPCGVCRTANRTVGGARRDGRAGRWGLTLVELLMAIVVIAVLAAVVLPSNDPSLHNQLLSAAETLASDLAYGRSLAVSNNSHYRFTFDFANNRYILEHSGANPALNVLPSNPFRSNNDLPTQFTVSLASLPLVGATVSLLAAAAFSTTTMDPVSRLEFGPLGQTTEARDSVIWLSAGTGPGQRYLPVFVNPTTGLATVGNYSGYGPPSNVIPAAAN